MRRRNNPEECVQRALVAWLRFQRPNLWFHATPNGGGRSKAEAGILKATGVKPGVADLTLIGRDGRVLWIEVKRPADRLRGQPAGYLSEQQRAFRDEMVSRGHDFAIARSVEDLERAIREWETDDGDRVAEEHARARGGDRDAA